MFGTVNTQITNVEPDLSSCGLEGGRVIISDDEGATLATTTLRSTVVTKPDPMLAVFVCSSSFSADVAKASVYHFSMEGEKTFAVYALREMQELNFNVELNVEP